MDGEPMSDKPDTRRRWRTILRDTRGATAVEYGLIMQELERDMANASANLEYERAALIRDQIAELKSGAGIDKISTSPRPVKYKSGGRRSPSRR